MDAIILCLGGRANSTGRQAAIKSFIKRNTEYFYLNIFLVIKIYFNFIL